MFYEEQVINGVLCYRSTPDGEWKQFTAEQLTSKLMESRRQPTIVPPVFPVPYPVYPSPTIPTYPQPWWQITCGPNTTGTQS